MGQAAFLTGARQSSCRRKRDRDIARERLADLIRRAAEPPKKRIATRVTQSQKRKRLQAKRQRGEVKALRGSVDPE